MWKIVFNGYVIIAIYIGLALRRLTDGNYSTLKWAEDRTNRMVDHVDIYIYPSVRHNNYIHNNK